MTPVTPDITAQTVQLNFFVIFCQVPLFHIWSLTLISQIQHYCIYIVVSDVLLTHFLEFFCHVPLMFTFNDMFFLS